MYYNTSVAVPTGVQAGDLLIAMVSNAAPSNLTTPAGWTLVSSLNWASYGYASAIYSRIATSSEPAGYAFGATNTIRCGFMAAYRNATSIVTSGSWQDLSGTSMPLTGITSPSGSLLLSLIQDRDPSVALVAPSGMTQRLDSSGGFYWRSGLAELANASNVNRTWTVSSTTYNAAGILIAIQ